MRLLVHRAAHIKVDARAKGASFVLSRQRVVALTGDNRLPRETRNLQTLRINLRVYGCGH